MLKVKIYEYDSPCGKLWLAAKKGKLCLCEWANGKNLKNNIARLAKTLNIEFVMPTDTEKPTSKVIVLAIKQLRQYFCGRRKRFSLPYLMAGTEFQQAVWKSLTDIPYGKSISYATIATQAGYPKAIRAAANTCGNNAIAIIIPCHRVIGSNTALTGYSGGLGVKRYLLDLESNQQRLPFKNKAPKARKQNYYRIVK